MGMLESLFKAACRIDNNMPRSIDLSDNIVDEETATEDPPDASSSENTVTEARENDHVVPDTNHTHAELEKRYERLNEYNLYLEGMLSKCNRSLERSKVARDCAEERLRRQMEILESCQVDLRTAIKENTGLVFQLSNLKKWTDSLNDDEATDMMRHAYIGVEKWIEYHFNHNAPGKTRRATDPINHLGLFYNIYASVGNGIFEAFLSGAMVGIDEPSLNKTIRIIDEEVQKQCPEHIRQHWRSATSIALSSLGEQGLDTRYEYLIDALETEYAHSSITDPERRRAQLKAVLRNFVQLKMRLERQVDQYFFERILPGTLFCKDRMTSLTGGCSGNEIVEYSLSPMLFKISSGYELTLMEKGTVKTRLTSSESPTEDTLDKEGNCDIWNNHRLFG